MNFRAKLENKLWSKYPSFLLIILFFMVVQMGCSTLELESIWRERELTVDGKGEDWLGSKYYLEDISISVGLINDDHDLYVSVMTENRMIIGQIMMQGLILWLDPKGGKEKTFGIKFPLGRQDGERMTPESMENQDQENMGERFREALTELAILGPGEKVVEKLDVEDAKGIDVKLRVEGGLLTYEIKVPLLSSEEHPYAVGAEKGDTIGFGLESPKLDMERPRGMRGGGMPGGGMGAGPPGGMGGRGGGSGMGMPGSGLQMPKPLKIWVAVRLASPSAEKQGR